MGTFETQIGEKFKVPMGCKTAEDNPQTKSNDIRPLFQADMPSKQKSSSTEERRIAEAMKIENEFGHRPLLRLLVCK